MIIGVLQSELFIPHAQSLKDKRAVLRSVKDNLHNKFNVSVSEIGYQDKWQRCMLAVVTVSNEKKQTSKTLDSVEAYLDMVGDMHVTDRYREYL